MTHPNPARRALEQQIAEDQAHYGDEAFEPDPWAEPEPEPDEDPWPDTDPFDPDEHAPQQSTNGHAKLLPADFWDTRHVLRHVRQAAWSRNRCPDVVLYTVLARIAAMAPHDVACDTGVGSPATVNFYAAPVGGPATGKTTGVSTGCELLTPPPWLDIADQLPLGSGEGVAEVYMGTVKEKDDRGKTVTVRKQVRHNAFFYVDEGEALTRTLERTGSTTGEALRRGWSGATLGQRNATDERTRIIHARTYSLGMVIGFQPTTIGALLADAPAGTPQRFIYCWAADPSIPTVQPSWPGGIAWNPPQAVPPGGYAIDPAIRKEIHETDLARARGEADVEQLDAHSTLTKVKTALLLALLEERVEVTLDDWALAEIIWQTSCHVRDYLVARVRAEAELREQASHERAARRQQTIDENEFERAMAAAHRQALAKVLRCHDSHPEPGCPPGCLKGAVANKYRKLISFDDLFLRMVSGQFLRRVGDGRFEPGRRAES